MKGGGWWMVGCGGQSSKDETKLGFPRINQFKLVFRHVSHAIPNFRGPTSYIGPTSCRKIRRPKFVAVQQNLQAHAVALPLYSPNYKRNSIQKRVFCLDFHDD